jgi:hypothetical protein
MIVNTIHLTAQFCWYRTYPLKIFVIE